MEIEVRRVQKLGSSSVVVTLPKEWAVRLGLKPGSQVMLVDEGDSIRVIPVGKRSEAGIVLDLSRMSPEMAVSVPTCLYLSGLDHATVKLPRNPQIIEEMKRRAMVFMGVQVYETAPYEARVEVLLDIDKVDLPRLIKSMGQTMTRLIALLESTLEGKMEGDAMVRADLLRKDFLRTLYVVLRYLMSRHAKTVDLVGNYQTALAASYMGFAVDLLQELVQTAEKLVDGSKLPDEDVVLLRRILRPMEESASILLRLLATPSAKRLAELYQSLGKVRKAAEEAMVRVSTPAAGVLAGKLHDILRLINIASYVATCRVIMRVSRTEA